MPTFAEFMLAVGLTALTFGLIGIGIGKVAANRGDDDDDQP